MYVACYSHNDYALRAEERFPSQIDALTYCRMLNAIHGYNSPLEPLFRVWSEMTAKWSD